MTDYDEERLRNQLVNRTRPQLTVFAAACAETLKPLLERYAAAVDMPQHDLNGLRGLLAQAWDVHRNPTIDLADAQDLAEGLVPHDDDENWRFESGYGQNAIAAIAYTARTWNTADPQEAVWAARQVYEAADYGAQRLLENERMRERDMEDRLLGVPAVQVALAALQRYAEGAAVDDPTRLRTDSSSVAQKMARLLP